MYYLSFIIFIIIAQTILATEYPCDCSMSSCDCSKQPENIREGVIKILGGVSARPNTWKWVVSIRKSNVHFCVGSILNERHIITAAHCFNDYAYDLLNITVCTGINFLSDTCRQLRSVEYVVNHPKFNTQTLENDMAIIRVDKSFDFMDTSIDFIHLPDASHNNEYSQNGTDVIVVGWGKTETGKLSDTLQEITLQIVDKSKDTCDDVVYNHTLQLCAAAPGKDTCQGDSGGPLMVFGASEQWELIGITSYGKGCAKGYAGVYTRVTSSLAFIQMMINNTLEEATNNTCYCQCPRGLYKGVAYTTEKTPEACVDACISISSNQCTSENTYACLGTNCTYSKSYQYAVARWKTLQRCSCECPRGSFEGYAATTGSTPEACINACFAFPLNPCIPKNTYACLETNCVYSGSYNYSIVVPTTQYTCSCQCPRGSFEGIAYTRRNNPEACLIACVSVSTNPCTLKNVYACLGTNCTHSDFYDNSTTASTALYRCTCQCPHGSYQGVAYTTTNTPEACVDACIAVLINPCTISNTYACLGTNCTYSDLYDHSIAMSTRNYTCSCQCPRGSYQGIAYTRTNTSEACISACIGVRLNPCTSRNTYACLGTNCTYSNLYNNSTITLMPQYTCSCQCPYGSSQGVAYTTTNTPEACISACISVSTNPCTISNTYACLGTNCTYSVFYDNSTATSTVLYRCACQCPHGSYTGVAYTTVNTSEACVNACISISSNQCTSENTYACLGTNCTYSYSYNDSTAMSTRNYTCSCQCPRGSYQGIAYTTTNTPEACVDACIAVLINPCTISNTYACLGTNCTYSDLYDHSTAMSTRNYTCSCQCPRGSYQGIAYTRTNTPEACIGACIGVQSNPCTSRNTYACLGTNCTYSYSYNNSTIAPIVFYRCACQCPHGSYPGVAYTTVNTSEACVNACIGFLTNECTSRNTYACLGTNCTYSDLYDHSIAMSTRNYTCSCQCPRGSYQGIAYTRTNTSEACISACIGVRLNPCTSRNTYACLGTNCTYSNLYNNSTITLMPQYTCSCQCPERSYQGVAYTTTNTSEGCISACILVGSNPCLRSNAYACLGTNCTYSDWYNYKITKNTATKF